MQTGIRTAVVSRRDWLLSLPGLAIAPRVLAQERAAALRVSGLQHVTLAVTDVARSLDFYQGLFGMPVQTRRDSTVLLRIGDRPLFLALTPTGERGPSIARFGMAVEDFDVERVAEVLSESGLVRDDDGPGAAVGPGRVRVTRRGDTPEVFVGDPNGLVVQLQDRRYCGGNDPLGDVCVSTEAAPARGALTTAGISHLTISVPDPEGTNDFYQRSFGMDIQAYQAASPLLGVGPGDDFLMFIDLGAPARVHHACLTVDRFSVEGVQTALESVGVRPRSEAGAGALRHWVSMRMPDRGGAPDGTPELYFSDPDGLPIQLQDPSYCGGGGYLGDVCA